MTRSKAAIIINIGIWIPLIALLIIGLLVSPIPNDSFGATSGWLSSGLFSMGVLSAGLFSVGVYSAGLFSVGIFSAGVFSIGIFSFGTYAIGVWVSGQFISGLFKNRIKEIPPKE